MASEEPPFNGPNNELQGLPHPRKASEACPFNDLNNELQEIPPNSEPRSAYIKLRYDWSTEKDIDPERWQPHLLAFHRNYRFTQILDAIEAYIHQRLRRLEPRTCRRLDQQESCIILKLTVEDEDVLKQHACTRDASGTSRLRYFSHLSEPRTRPEFDVLLHAVEVCGKRPENGRRVEVRTRDDALPRVQYFTIGSVLDVVTVVEKDVVEKDNKREVSNNVEKGKKKGVSDVVERDSKKGDAKTIQQTQSNLCHIKIMECFFWKCSSDAAQPPVIVQMPAWQHGAARMCDVDHESIVDTTLTIPENFEWDQANKDLMQIGEAKTFRSLLDTFRNPRDNVKLTPHDFTTNGRATYTFWDVSVASPDPAKFPEGMKKRISVVVRFVQHLQPTANTTFNFSLKEIWALPENSGHSKVKKEIVDALRNMPGAQALFNHPYLFERNWDLQFWVRYQGLKNLFRLKPGRLLRHFLDQDLLNQKDASIYLEAHIVPRGSKQAESLPTDQLTDAVLDGVDNDQLHIRFTYDLKGLPGLRSIEEKKDPKTPRDPLSIEDTSQVSQLSQVLHFRKSRSLQSLFDDLADFVTSKLENDQLECHTKLRETESYILLNAVLDHLAHPCPVKRRAFVFDDSGIARVSTIDDLVSAGTTIKPQLNIRLKIIESLKRSASTDPMVVIRSGATGKDAGGLSQFYRIGHVPRQQPQDHRIATADTFFWQESLVTRKLALVKSSTWTLRNFDICNPDEGKHLTPRQHGEAPSSIGECETRVLNGTMPLFLQGRLLYSFKTFEKKLSCPEPVDAVPSSGISAALRFISHLEIDEASKISFDNDSELSLEDTDTPDTIQQEITRGLSTNSHGNTKTLCKEPLVSSWDMQLWILPQVANGTTLYRYSSEVAGLHRFLNRPELDKGDSSLFIEVHLVPKPQKTRRRQEPQEESLRGLQAC